MMFSRLLALVPIAFCPFLLVANPPASGLQVWLKADAEVATNAGDVSSWTDQSANGILFTASGSGTVLDNEPDLGGAPVVRFSGDGWLSGALAGQTWTTGMVYAVMRYTIASSNNDYLYTFGSGGSGGQWTASRRSGSQAYHYDGSAQYTSGPGAIPAGEFTVLRQIYGETSPRSHDWSLDTRSILQVEASGDYSINAGLLRVGSWSTGGFRFIGDLAELIVYDRVLDCEERGQVEDYLLRKYGWPGFLANEPEDFDTWEVVQYEVGGQSDAQWVVAADGLSVDQLVNADPSIFLSQATFSRGTIEGQIGSGSAPDFMGFVFGYQDRGRFYVFDWKKSGASYLDFGFAQAGMRLRVFHVEGDPTGGDFWSSADPAHVTVLRSNNVPWVNGALYDYRLDFQPGLIEIEIRDGTTVVESWTVADSTYTSGRFGYYINSLQDVFYGQLSFDLDPNAGDLRIVRAENVGCYFELGWEGGMPPYTLEENTGLFEPDWTPRATGLSTRFLRLPMPDERHFYRIVDSSGVIVVE